MVSPARRSTDDAAALVGAARLALHAPSVFNTQPWRWRVDAGVLELRADANRKLTVVDPLGRLLTISCGAALHHARLALAAAGRPALVDRLPEADDPALLARLRPGPPRAVEPEDQRLAAAVPRRRTDRRAFAERPVPAASLARLRASVEAQGARLHVVRTDQMPMLAVATAQAAAAELADPAYLHELSRWTHRPPWSGDGVPEATAVRPAPRRVPVRDHTPDGAAGLAAGPGNDRGAVYAVLYGGTDDRAGWLRGGEALSALLLTAAADGLSAAPLSDAIEVAWPRRLMRDLLPGQGEPYLVVRVGLPVGGELPPVPRRDPDEVIEFAEGTAHD